MEAPVQAPPDNQFTLESAKDSASALRPAVRQCAPGKFIDFPGRRLSLLALTPASLFGIAVGATAVVLKMADASAHLWGMAIIWGAATVVSILAIVVGMRETAGYLRIWSGFGNAGDIDSGKAVPDEVKPEEWPSAPARYQSLKSLKTDG